MSISQSLKTLSTGAVTALNSVAGEIVDLYIVPTTTIILGNATVTSSGGGIALTTGGAVPPFCIRVPAGDILYAGIASSSAITVSVLTRTL